MDKILKRGNAYRKLISSGKYTEEYLNSLTPFQTSKDIIPMPVNFLFEDIIYNELLKHVDFNTLINFYKTNSKFRQLLDDKNMLVTLYNKYNLYNIYLPTYTFYDLIYSYFDKYLIRYCAENITTLEGQILFSLNKILYRYYNDGEFVFISKDLNKPKSFLSKYGYKEYFEEIKLSVKYRNTKFKELCEFFKLYEIWLEKLKYAVINDIISRNGNYRKKSEYPFY